MKLTSNVKTLLCGALALSAVGLYSAPASAQSLRAYCEDYAYGEAVNRGRGRVLGGSTVGAAAGAILGGIAGGGRGAAIGAAAGAATGAVGGLVSKRGRRGRVADQAYADCIAANSPRRAPQRVRGGGYEPWSPEWYDYCSRKYRSFNPSTGYYFYRKGKQRFCQ